MNAGVPRRGAGRAAAVHHHRPGGRGGRAADRGRRVRGDSHARRRSRAEPVAGTGGGALCRTWRRGSPNLGFTVNFGPVVDLDDQPEQPGDRQVRAGLRQDRGCGRAYAEAFVKAHRDGGRADGAQAFPRARVEHGGQPRGLRRHHRDVEARASSSPIATMIADGLADFVMVGHLIDTDVDAERPAVEPVAAVDHRRAARASSATTAW